MVSVDLPSLPAVARRVFIECKKCDVGRYHVVLAHKTAKSARVECEVCKGKKTMTLKKADGSAPKPTKSKKNLNTADLWLEHKGSSDLSSCEPYNMRASFNSGAVIDHPKFGLGFVQQVTETSVEVIFEDSIRSLVHNRTAQ